MQARKVSTANCSSVNTREARPRRRASDSGVPDDSARIEPHRAAAAKSAPAVSLCCGACGILLPTPFPCASNKRLALVPSRSMMALPV